MMADGREGGNTPAIQRVRSHLVKRLGLVIASHLRRTLFIVPNVTSRSGSGGYSYHSVISPINSASSPPVSENGCHQARAG